MNHINELEVQIRSSYGLIRNFEDIKLDSPNPKERLRCKREIRQLWDDIEQNVKEYVQVSSRLNEPIAEDIRTIAARFPEFLAHDVSIAIAELKQNLPADRTKALDHLTGALTELARLHREANEWKELHNLVQESVTSLILLRSELEHGLDFPGDWRRTTGLRSWEVTRLQIRKLETFTGSIEYIDQPFFRDEDGISGPAWMVQIVALASDLDNQLREGGPEGSYDLVRELWDTCYDTLYQADKRLRDMIGELYEFSAIMLRSMNNEQVT